MCGYNRLNGVWCSDHRWLLTTVLREQWGFRGLVVSDWAGTNDRVAGVAAGMDLEMPASGGINPNPNTNPNPNQATAFAMDCIPRTLSRGQSFDALSSQAYVYIYSSQATTAGRRPNPSLTPDPHS